MGRAGIDATPSSGADPRQQRLPGLHRDRPGESPSLEPGEESRVTKTNLTRALSRKQTMHMDPELRKNQSAEVPLGRESPRARLHTRPPIRAQRETDAGRVFRRPLLAGFSKPWEQAGQVVYFLSKYSSCKSPAPPFFRVCVLDGRKLILGVCNPFFSLAGEQTRPVRALTSTA